MKIPLSMFAMDDSLLIYRNGSLDKVEFPFKPFILLQKDNFPEVLGKEEVWHKVPDDEDRVYRRLEFNTTRDQLDFKKRQTNKARYMFMNSYAEQLYISAEDFLLDYPHTNDLTIMFWDIEVASKGDGLFPKALTNEILAIGYSIWKYDNLGNKRKICQNICKGFDITTMSDKPVIDAFLNAVQEHDPDVIAGYNTDEFDFPYLIERAKIVNSDLTMLGRGGREPTIREEGDIKIRIPGRIHFDMYNSNSGVVKDQSLFGIKSKTLKDLGRWYKAKRTRFIENKWFVDEMDDIEVKEHIENLLKLFIENPELLYSYLDDDIYRTEGVGHVYLRNCITLAEMMHVPLDNIICMYSSFVPKLLVARNMEKLRLINTESNFNRYNSSTGSIAKIGLKYEGAIVGLYKDGYQPATWKLDYQSQYPSSIQTWNLGPDTTSLVRVEEYTGQYNCIVKDNYNWYRIPTYFDDGKYKYDLIVKVRNDKEGFLKQAITNFKAERKKIRTEMKSLSENDDKYSALYAQQLAIKVIMNCFHPDTEILTSDGIKLLKDIKIGELVWSINPTTFKAELKPVEKTYEYDVVNQDLHIIKHQRFSQMITDGHKMLGFDGKKCFFEEAKDFTKRNRVKIPCHINNNISYPEIDLLDYVDSSKYEIIILHKEDLRKLKTEFPLVNFIKTPSIKNGSIITTTWNNSVRKILDHGYTLLARPKRSRKCSAVPIRVNNISFSQFVGWYLSEGSIYTSTNKIFNTILRGTTNKITISQDNINFDIKNEMNSVLDHLLYNSIKTKVYRNSKQLSFSSDLYAEIIDTHLGRTTNKFVSNKIKKNLNITSILNAMYQGDGTKGQRKYTISQKYQKLFNSYIDMLILDGRTFNYHVDSGCYRIVDSTEDITINKTNNSIIKYTGKVYSLTVKDNHTVYAGINGSMSWIGQSVYGFLGLKTSNYGDTISATMVTSLCRWCILKCMQRNEDKLIEVDTDGFIINSKLDPKVENEWLTKEIKDKFNITDNHMQLELEGDGEAAYFYMMKNYIKLKGEGKYEIHGSSFKTSRSAKIVDRAIKLGINHIFNNKPIEEVLDEAYNFKGLGIEDFQERVKMSKDPIEYDDQYDWRLFLAKQVEMKTGQIITSGAQMLYVVTKEQLPQKEFKQYYRSGKNYTYIAFITSIKEIDFEYYTELVDKALLKFGISKKKFQQTSLFDQPEKVPIKKTELDFVPKDKL